jgi:P4 family phage/plasmid primase-like protien
MIDRDNPTRSLIPDSELLSQFEAYPYSGIGILGLTRNGDDDLLLIDVDVDDAATITAVCCAISYPCPVRMGRPGRLAFIVRTSAPLLPEILASRGIPNQSTVKDSHIKLKHMPGRKQEIELIRGGRHIVLPPTKHLEASIEAGSSVHYQWVPFPLTPSAPVLTVENTPHSDLPILSEGDLLLLYCFANKHNSVIWQFLGQSGPGYFHHVADAVFHMVHQKFTDDEIRAICEAEIDRISGGDAAKDSERRKDVDLAISTARRKIKDTPKPAKEKAPRGQPDDRKIYAWLENLFPIESRITYGITPHVWQDDMWTPLVDHYQQVPHRLLFNQALDEFPSVSLSDVNAAISRFLEGIERYRAPDTEEGRMAERCHIAFSNGVLDVRSLTLRPERREDYMEGRLKYPWDPSARSPLWDKFVRGLLKPPDTIEFNDENEYNSDWDHAVRTLEGFLGYCLTRSHFTHNMLFLIGKTGTGKSELFKLFGAMMPKEWISSIAMEDMDNPNSRRDMVNARVNISNEVGRRDRKMEALLLKVTAGEPVEVKTLYKDVSSVTLQARLIFQGNEMPDVSDIHGAIQRRIIILRSTDDRPAVKVPDKHMEMLTEAPGILRRWVEAYRDVANKPTVFKDDPWFDLPNYARALAKQVNDDNNSAIAWRNENTETVDDVRDGLANVQLYGNYQEYCEARGFKPFSIVGWAKVLEATGVHARQVYVAGRNMKLRPLRLLNNQTASY